MAQAKKSAPAWLQYPTPQAQRGGCKVSWNYYIKREDAEACSRAAAHNANIALSEGYDFGYCSPGSLRQCKPDEQWNKFGKELAVGGMFEVCLP